MTNDLVGRVVLITGASSGIGLRLAEALAKDGAKVVCCARRTDILERLVDRVSVQGFEALVARCDVADEKSVASAFDAAEANFGPVDSVIVNAGANAPALALTAPIETFDSIVGVNLRGAFLTAREGAKRMIDRDVDKEYRRIIFIASILGVQPKIGSAVYSASKAAVIMLAKSLALEWARRSINVNSICPGFIRTEATNAYLDSEAGHEMRGNWPRNAVMEWEQLLPVVQMLLSPGSSAVTGSNIIVDDGQSLN